MSLAGWMHTMLGLSIGPTAEERANAHRFFRERVHAHRNVVSNTIGSAVASRKISEQALRVLDETVTEQLADMHLRSVMTHFVDELRDRR